MYALIYIGLKRPPVSGYKSLSAIVNMELNNLIVIDVKTHDKSKDNLKVGNYVKLIGKFRKRNIY